QHLSGDSAISSMGLMFPFVLAAILKTAQGSSSVAIITTATMVLPMLSSLGLNSEMARVFTVLAMGAGSMMVSHANDSYFWVISRFSGVGMPMMLRVFAVATLLMGTVAMAVTYVLYLFIRYTLERRCNEFLSLPTLLSMHLTHKPPRKQSAKACAIVDWIVK